MPFIPVPNGIQLCFDWLLSGQFVQFCLQLRKSAGAVVPADLAQVTAAAETWFTGDYFGKVSPQALLRQVRATDLSVQGGSQDINPVGVAGGSGTVSEANNVSIVVSQRTAKRGRAYRGRAYTTGLDQAKRLSPTQVTSAYAAQILSSFTGLQTTLDVIGFDVVVATKQLNGAVVNPAETNEVIAFVVDQNFDSQRRRLEGRGS